MNTDSLDHPILNSTDDRFSNAAIEEINETRRLQTQLTGDANLELASYRISKEHARNLCSGLNELQNQLCMDAWKRSGYKSDSSFARHETFGEMWAREEKEMKSFERKYHFRPLDRRAPWNRDPNRMKADGTVRCLGAETPYFSGIEALRCRD